MNFSKNNTNQLITELVAKKGLPGVIQYIKELHEEYEKQLEAGFEEVYKTLVAERNEYEKKLKELKDYIVTKIDSYLDHTAKN